jgi:multidrug efflux pump subunit AcrA (membrane-fusion protein)
VDVRGIDIESMASDDQLQLLTKMGHLQKQVATSNRARRHLSHTHGGEKSKKTGLRIDFALPFRRSFVLPSIRASETYISVRKSGTRGDCRFPGRRRASCYAWRWWWPPSPVFGRHYVPYACISPKRSPTSDAARQASAELSFRPRLKVCNFEIDAAKTLPLIQARCENQTTGPPSRHQFGGPVAHAKGDGSQGRPLLADAKVAKAQVMVDFATIRSPYDGYITQRSMLPGDFVRAGTEGGANVPLLTVERTDKMRVVVQIPDRDVPYCDPGAPATVEIDALGGQKIAAKVSRIARSEDLNTKLMRVEIDVPNQQGLIRQGMYGWVTILLDKAPDQLSIPSACLVGKAQEGKGSVYIVRDGRAQLVPVRLGIDYGKLVAIQNGLSANDQVIAVVPPGLQDGTPVQVSKPAPGEGR